MVYEEEWADVCMAAGNSGSVALLEVMSVFRHMYLGAREADRVFCC